MLSRLWHSSTRARKLLLAACGVLAIVIVLFCAWYVWEHRGIKIDSIEHDHWEVSLYRYPSGFSTIGSTHVYARKTEEEEKRILVAKGCDTLGIRFRDSVTLEITDLRRLREPPVKQWYAIDTLIIDLRKPLQTLRVEATTPISRAHL